MSYESVVTGKLWFKADVAINQNWTDEDLSKLRDYISGAIRSNFNYAMLLGEGEINLVFGDDRAHNE